MVAVCNNFNAFGAPLYQLWDEALPGLSPGIDPDQPSFGQRSLSGAMGQAGRNILGIGSVVRDRIKENPFAFLPAIFSAQKTQEPFYSIDQGIESGNALTTGLAGGTLTGTSKLILDA